MDPFQLAPIALALLAALMGIRWWGPRLTRRFLPQSSLLRRWAGPLWTGCFALSAAIGLYAVWKMPGLVANDPRWFAERFPQDRDIALLRSRLQQAMDDRFVQEAAVQGPLEFSEPIELRATASVADAARELEDRLRRFSPRDAADWQEMQLAMAALALARSRPPQALAALDALAAPPAQLHSALLAGRSAALEQLRGDAHYALGQWNEARECYGRLLDLAPDHAPDHALVRLRIAACESQLVALRR